MIVGHNRICVGWGGERELRQREREKRERERKREGGRQRGTKRVGVVELNLFFKRIDYFRRHFIWRLSGTVRTSIDLYWCATVNKENPKSSS